MAKMYHNNPMRQRHI